MSAVKPCFLLLPLLALVGCASQPHHGTHPVSREMRQQGIDPPCFTVTGRDEEMKQAVQQARKTVGKFVTALRHPTAAQHDFEVKKRFVQGDAKEHIWLSHVTYSGHLIYGDIDNHPRKIKGLKIGQRVSVKPGEISDWAYIDKGKLVGGYTIRVLLSGCDPAVKARMEHQGHFLIGNP